MKLFLTSAAVLLALCTAEQAPESSSNLRGRRELGRGGRLQNMIDTECPTFSCGGNEGSGCTLSFEKPQRPDITGMDEDEIAQLKSEMQAKKEEFKQNILKCACCDNMSVEDILAARGDQGGSRPFGGGGGGGRPGMSSGGGDDSGRPTGMGGDRGDGSRLPPRLQGGSVRQPGAEIETSTVGTFGAEDSTSGDGLFDSTSGDGSVSSSGD